VKLWGTVAVAALGVLAPAMGRADIVGYTFTVPVKIGTVSGLDISDSGPLQVGDVNNKGQFSLNLNSGTQGGELEYVWDGATLIKLTDPEKTLPDGSAPGLGNTWSPHGINNNGKVAWAIDVGEGGTGSQYTIVYDLATKAYTIVQRPGDPAPGGGTYGNAANGLRQIVDINDLDQVVFPNSRTASDGTDHNAIYLYDLKTKEGKLIAANGMKTADGKTLTDAWYPDANNSSQISFTASVDGTTFGVYRAEADGTITPIIPAGSTIDGVQIGSARRARLNNNGDIVALVDVNGADGGAGGEGGDDIAVALYSQADKSVHLIAKPGDKVPGGTFRGVEGNLRAVGITDSGQVFILGVLEEAAADGTQLDGVYRWDPTSRTIDALVLGQSTVPGLGQVGGVTKGNGGLTGYHLGVSGDGHVAFPAVVDGVEGIVVATPPAPAAGG
jgi:hypothetical protein